MGFMQNNYMNKQQAAIYGTNLVDGWNGAVSFEMLPNQTAVLVDRTSPTPRVFFKSSNEYGMTKALTAYDCKDITNELMNAQNGMQPNSNYVTKEDIEAIIRNTITEILGGKQNEPAG